MEWIETSDSEKVLERPMFGVVLRRNVEKVREKKIKKLGRMNSIFDCIEFEIICLEMGF